MKINVDSLTDAEVMELQDHQWSDEEFRGKKDSWSKAMLELCENMRSMTPSAYRDYLKKCEQRWHEVNG